MRPRQAWTIPFNNVNHLCWREGNTSLNRKMTPSEERQYFDSDDQEEYLNELVRSK